MYILPSHFSQIDSRIILCSVLRFYKWSLSFRFSHQFLYAPLLSPICSTCPASLIFLELINWIFCEEFKRWSSVLWDFVQPPGTACLLHWCVFLSILFLTMFGLCSLNVRYWEFYTDIHNNKIIGEVFTFLGYCKAQFGTAYLCFGTLC